MQPMGNPEMEEPGEFDNEFKTIPTVQTSEPPQEPPMEPQPQPQQEDDVLFGDAPDYRTKKVGYN